MIEADSQRESENTKNTKKYFFVLYLVNVLDYFLYFYVLEFKN